jgi:hypothetical protein
MNSGRWCREGIRCPPETTTTTGYCQEEKQEGRANHDSRETYVLLNEESSTRIFLSRLLLNEKYVSIKEKQEPDTSLLCLSLLVASDRLRASAPGSKVQ